MSYLAQDLGEGPSDPSLLDNRTLDQFEIPFGSWIDQAVDWITVNLDWFLSIVEWPFSTLISFVVDDILEPISWVWVVLAFFVVGTLVRNVKVGAFAAVGLGICGILGNNYWLETARTIGFIGVAVLLCVLVGIPLGIACGRMDPLWQIVRPVLDAMQVVHSFVYMLPFIYFFGIGEVSATMVTMVFALPPLVRLTNLGIRQVPEDVVEASRAYGAPEWRVLADVQVPLARPAIMTGINQTLLLSISMLGIAAIMGAGGLGRLLFGALSRQSVAEGAASGLAFFLVAVVLDRMSQNEGESRSLLRRIGLAFAHRRNPERLLTESDSESESDEASDESSAADGSFTSVSTVERNSILIAGVGGLIAAVSVFFTWNSGAGFLSAYGRRIDQELAGQSFNGLSATGGSWFGYLALAFGLFVIASAVTSLRTPGRGLRWCAADGALLSSLALLVTMIAYLLASAPDLTMGQSKGVGVYLAFIGAVVATVGSLWWIRVAPHTPEHPLRASIDWGRLIGSLAAVVIIGIGSISGWSFDERAEVVITPEVQAKLDALRQKEDENPLNAGVISVEILTLESQLRAEKRIITDGVSSTGAGLGKWTFLAGLVGLIVALPAAGVFGWGERRLWIWSAITAGISAGIAAVGFGWIFTHVRSADPNYFTGVGAFLTMVGGAVLVGTTLSVLKEFRRTRVYADIVIADA